MAVIFVGNGINRTEGLVYSWEDLLDKVVEHLYSEKSKKDGNKAVAGIVPQRPKVKGLSMTMGFELLEFFSVDHGLAANGYKLKKSIAKVIRDKIRERVKDNGFNWHNTLHAQIMRLPVQTYLTTNYDYALEQSVRPDFVRKPSTREREYSRMRCQTINVDGHTKTIYHIHGEIDAPNSICLGFEHYSGTLEKMRGDLLRGTHDPQIDNDAHSFHLRDVMTEVEPADNCWYLKVFTEDVYILGFNIEFAEQDLWWLLDYRYRKIREGKLPITNRIYYIDVNSQEERKEQNIIARNIALTKFGVEVLVAEGKAYLDRYNWAIEWIEKQLVSCNCR